jgi:hypothetical protein
VSFYGVVEIEIAITTQQGCHIHMKPLEQLKSACRLYLTALAVQHSATRKIRYGEISGSQGVSIEMAVFWVVVPCSLVEDYRHFRGG